MSQSKKQIHGDAHALWEGGLTRGSGRLAEGGAAGGTAISWRGRVERSAGGRPTTTPEELIAAAHAGCYSMSLAGVLDESGRPADRLDVQTSCRAELGDEGLAIRAIDVTVRGVVPGLEDQEFARLAAVAEQRCPVSNSMRGNVEIRVDAALEPEPSG